MRLHMQEVLLLLTLLAFGTSVFAADDGRLNDYGKTVIQNIDKTSQERGTAVYNNAFQSRVDAQRSAGDEAGALRTEQNESRKAQNYYQSTNATSNTSNTSNTTSNTSSSSNSRSNSNSSSRSNSRSDSCRNCSSTQGR